MGKKVGFFMRCRRLERKLRYGQLAELLGVERPSAKNKFCRSLTALEGGSYTQELLQQVFNALGLGVEEAAKIAELARQEEAEYQKHLDEPVQRQLVMRWAAAICTGSNVPTHLSDEEAIAWAKEYLSKYPVRACLILSRRRRVWFKGHGVVESVDEVQPNQQDTPSMMIGNKPFLLRPE